MLIREKDWKAICALMSESFSVPVTVWAYGSRVNGMAHEMSDLDLVVLSQDEQPLDLSELAAFKEKLTQSNIPILVQVLDWNRMPERFRAQILKQHEVFWSNSAALSPL
jgi:predicted nucleotidyltransferase